MHFHRRCPDLITLQAPGHKTPADGQTGYRACKVGRNKVFGKSAAEPGIFMYEAEQRGMQEIT